MEYKTIDRLTEDHENQLPPELLNMTVGEMLDKVGELDTKGDAEYETVEDALIAVNNKILAGGYQNGEELKFTKDETVEKKPEEKEIKFTDDEKNGGMPSFEQVDDSSGNKSGSESGNNSGSGNLDNFSF